MENTHTMGPLGASLEPGGGAQPADASASHGDVVVEALSHPVRLLIAAVLIVNLTLAGWLISRSDFSELKPQSAADAFQMGGAEGVGTEKLEARSPRLSLATANERD